MRAFEGTQAHLFHQFLDGAAAVRGYPAEADFPIEPCREPHTAFIRRPERRRVGNDMVRTSDA